MSPVKRSANAGYRWLEQNPVTGIFISVAVTITLVGALGIYSSSTFQAKTACSNPESRECAEVRLDVARAEPIRNQCVPFQRVTGERGRNCKRFYIPQGAEGQIQTNSKSVQDLEVGSGGVEKQPGPGGGGGGLAPADGGGSPGGQGGGHPKGQKTPPVASDPAPVADSDSPPADNETDTPPPSSSTRQPVLPSTVEATGKAAGEVVGAAGGTATGVVGGTTDSLCKLTNSCGP